LRIEGLIAVRYLFSRKQRSVVNVISWISLVGLMVSTTALIVVLSVYNGIGDITKNLFGTFDPELSIEPSQGKTFHTSALDLQELSTIEGVDKISCLTEEIAWITHGQNQAIIKLRGVDEQYAVVTGIDTLVLHGNYTLGNSQTQTLIVGGQIFHDLAMTIPATMPAAIHIPKRGTTAIGHTTDEAFNIGYAYPVANFFIQQDIDRQYVITDIDFVRQLMRYDSDEVTSLALKLKPDADLDEVKLGNLEAARRQLECIEGLEVARTTDEAWSLMETLVDAHALPEKARTDALHVAMAAIRGADLLLTWNCRHIANPVMLPKIYSTLEKAGFKCPAIATPGQLLEAGGTEP